MALAFSFTFCSSFASMAASEFQDAVASMAWGVAPSRDDAVEHANLECEFSAPRTIGSPRTYLYDISL